MRQLSMAIVTVMLLGAAVAARAQDAAKPVSATPQNIAAFLGEWTISTSNSSYGNANLTMTLKVADGKVVGDVSDANGTHVLGSVSKSGTSLVATYGFDYQGMPLDAVVTLTPNEKNDKQIDAYVDFANGAAQFVGTATKK